MGQGFRRVKRLLAFAAGAAALTVPVAIAGDEGPLYTAPDIGGGAMIDETPRAWFVQLGSAPVVKGGTAAETEQDKADFRREASDEGIELKVRESYDKIWNGLSVEVDGDDLGALSALPGVTAIFPVIPMQFDPGTAISPELATALTMTGADNAQDRGFTGTGIRVAVMDTGVDYDHPDLGGCFGEGCRVETGFDFVGDAFNANPTSPTFNPTPVPDPDPDDCNGHGTHVAGIIGASPAAAGGAKGVAPDVTFGAYRVFGCEGSTTADIMLAAMERALEDDMDVLNMSIGSAFQTWPQYPTAAGSDALVEEGMVVVASIGNSGANGVYSAGAPGVGNDVIGVASFDNSHISALSFTVNPSGRQVPYLQISNTLTAPTSGTTPEIVFVGQGCNADPYLASPSGKVALIVRGACTFNEKYQRAVNNGAVAVVIYNNLPGLFAGGGIVNRNVSAVGISLADGMHIRGLAAPTLTWTANRVNAPNPAGGLISSFSSYGLNAELTLKPDIGAPGGLIRSTLPLEQGGYGISSGTSMSSPHVAGAAALLLQANDDLEPADVRTILQNSADPQELFFARGSGLLEVVHRQGAGMVDIDDAIAATVMVSPGKLSLGESAAGPAVRTLRIENEGEEDVTYTLSNASAVSTGGATNAPSFFLGNATVAFSSPTVTVEAGDEAEVTVTITQPLTSRRQYGGYIVLTPQAGGQPLRVPYAGFAGDYQSIQVMTPTPFGFPWLAKLVGSSFVNQPSGATFTLQGNDQPRVLIHFEHQARRLEATVVNAATGLPIAEESSIAFEADFMPRNSTSTAFFAFVWDGTRIDEDGDEDGGPERVAVPDGQYKLVVRVLKALGDPANPAHTETWTSPTITIARP